MDLGAAGLHEQPFRTHGRPLTTVPYGSYGEGFRVLEACCAQANGLCLIQGPTLSGKTTLIRDFADSLTEDQQIAVVDGRDLNTAGLLEAILGQFGFTLDQSSTNELMGLLRVFTLQQASAHEPPVLVIENTFGLKASALRTLCELAKLRARWSSALKIVLMSDRPLMPLLQSPEMRPLANRLTHDFHLHPMSNDEALRYIHTKLRAAGSDAPDFIFPLSICTELWRASGGWPGILDRIALLALAKADTLPVPQDCVERPVLPQGTWSQANGSNADAAESVPAAPTLYISHEGELIRELNLEMPRLLIGRSEHNDVAITSPFISRHHALLVRHAGATFLMDLNSSNGTFVNSRRVSNHVLMHDDVISIGHHRIKYVDPEAKQHASLDGPDFADTIIMKSLDDMRRILAHENTEILPSATENLPTAGL